MRTIPYFILLALAPLCCLHAQTELTVTVTGIEAVNRGKVVFMLYDSDDGFGSDPTKAAHRAAVSEFSDRASHTFYVPPGTYAISAYQDLNNNGELDTNFVGYPKEPISAYRVTKMGLSRPKFVESSLKVAEEALSVTLQVINQ